MPPLEEELELELPPEDDELLEELELELELLLDEEELDELLDESNTGGLASEPLLPPPQAVNSTDTATAAAAIKNFCCMVYL